MPGELQVQEEMVDGTVVDPIPPSTALLFAPIDKRAFGVAIGTASALLVAGATIAVLVGDDPWLGLSLLSQYFAGYSVSWPGVLIGALWAFGAGFIAGWLIAFTRNLTLAVSLFLIRSKVELDETSDFLDHI